jgi:hypothetical protein
MVWPFNISHNLPFKAFYINMRKVYFACIMSLCIWIFIMFSSFDKLFMLKINIKSFIEVWTTTLFFQIKLNIK